MNGPRELWVAAFTGEHIEGTAYLALPQRWQHPADGREAEDTRYVRADIADEMLEALKEVHSMFGANDLGADLAAHIESAIAKAEGDIE